MPDTNMDQSLSLGDYISQYSGHQRITRLISIVENAAHSRDVPE